MVQIDQVGHNDVAAKHLWEREHGSIVTSPRAFSDERTLGLAPLVWSGVDEGAVVGLLNTLPRCVVQRPKGPSSPEDVIVLRL